MVLVDRNSVLSGVSYDYRVLRQYENQYWYVTVIITLQMISTLAFKD